MNILQPWSYQFFQEAEADRARLLLHEEGAWAEDPSSPNMDVLPIVDSNFKQDTDTEQSETIRGDKQVDDTSRTFFEASGDLSFELAYGIYDPLMAAGLGASWPGSQLDISGQIDVDATADQFTSDTSASGPDLSAVSEGQVIRVAGLSNEENNGYFVVTATDFSTATHKLTVDVTHLASGLTTETGDGDEAIDGEMIRTGLDDRSFLIEKQFRDVGEYFSYRGMKVGTLDLSFPTQGMLGGSFGLQGKGEYPAGSTVGDGSPNAAVSTPKMAAGEGVQVFRENAANVAILEASLSVARNLRSKPEMAEQGNIDVGVGTFNITGSYSAYFRNRTQLERYNQYNETSILLVNEDANGNAYMFLLPRVEYDDGEAPIPGQNEDIVAEFDFVATRDPSRNAMMQMGRIAA